MIRVDQLIGKLTRMSVREDDAAVNISDGTSKSTMVGENEDQLYGERNHYQYQNDSTRYQQVQDVAPSGNDNQFSTVERTNGNSRKIIKSWSHGVMVITSSILKF